MATNKNQHFVPRCYLRQFTVDFNNREINIFNIDRIKFIEHAPVKNQCSGDYFYGKDELLEEGLQSFENGYGNIIREILKPGYKLNNYHRSFLLRYWLLQFLRTDAASRRAMEMTKSIRNNLHFNVPDFRFEIKKAVQMAMYAFAKEMDAVDDLNVCLIKNQSSIPFIASDDPAILTNRWYLMDRRTRGKSFGVKSSGAILILPLSPTILFLGYDRDVYSLSPNNGWIKVRNEKDISALNQHQPLNCFANIFVHDSLFSSYVYDLFRSTAPIRPKKRHLVHYAILDKTDRDFKHYRVVEPASIIGHQESLIHAQNVHPQPSTWPIQLGWRSRGFAFTNGTGVGYVRRAWVSGHGYRKELVRKAK